MHKTKFSFLTALLLAAGTLSRAQLIDPAAKQICAGVKDVQLPAQDRPSAAEAKLLAKCVSEDLYYGFDRPPDYVKARKCAYTEMDRGVADVPFAGRTILMMAYANGRGATRNMDVALKLACEVEVAPGDWAGRIHQLERMRKSNSTAAFDACDHSGGNPMYEQCAIVGDRFDIPKRKKQLEDLSAKWTPAEKNALQALRETAAPFFKLRATKETDLRYTFEVQEMALLQNNFIEALQKLEGGELPNFSEADLKLAEEDLNGAYERTQNGKVTTWGTVTAEDIKTTQAAWLKYRDAWIALGKRKYPKVSEVSWKTWLDQQRREMLEKFMH
jgi:uncharacterized protein YecT (DUF1311 family)